MFINTLRRSLLLYHTYTPIRKFSSQDTTQYWQHIWNTDNGASFHINTVNSNIQKYISHIFGTHTTESHDAQAIKVLVPLCGKSLDLVWLADQGADVTGVELIAQPIQEWFSLHGVNPPNMTDIFTMPSEAINGDGSAKIIQGNFLTLSDKLLDNDFDAIWDRGGITSVPGNTSVEYLDRCYQSLKPGGTMLIEILTSNATHLSGTHLTAAKLQYLLKKVGFINVTKLHSRNVLQEKMGVVSPGMTQLDEHVFLAHKQAV